MKQVDHLYDYDDDNDNDYDDDFVLKLTMYSFSDL